MKWNSGRGCFLLLLSLAFLCSACSENIAAMQSHAPSSPSIRRFDLSANQRIRDILGDLTTRGGGSDTGIALFPGEKVEIFATGSATVGLHNTVSGPQGNTDCQRSSMPEPTLPCYALLYSVTATGKAVEVASHVAFVATTEGNLHLGFNTTSQAKNSGLFHLTVVVIPPGMTFGMWNSPQSNFTVQGTYVDLSAHIFASGNAVHSVHFTASFPGEAPVTICRGISVDSANYTCRWDARPQGSYLHNGKVTFGFVLDEDQGKSLLNPDGMRSGIVRYVVTQSNDIYAGYAAMDFTRPISHKKISAQWVIPTASCSFAETSMSAIWVGITGTSDTSKLAQVATESSCQNGIPQYDAAWELFPEPAIPIDHPVQPGDKISASVSFQNGKFQMAIEDARAGWHFSISRPGVVADTRIAECIAEAPTLENAATNESQVAQLTNFGTIHISCQMNGNAAIGDGPQNVRYQMDTGTARAITSELDPGGTDFTVQWKRK
jgi:Peptidase A4 family